MLNVGVIGTGGMGKNHVRVCSEIEDVKLVGIVDKNRKVAESIANKFDIEIFSSCKEISPEIDAAIIATPTATHYGVAMELLYNGKHVLVEKPICVNIERAQKLVTMAEVNNLVLAVGHIERHNPATKFVKDSITQRKFGDLITLTAKRVSNLPGRIRDVGVLLDLGIHDIDIMRFLAGEVQSVYAKTGRFSETIDYEDHAIIVLHFENNICGVIEINWLTPMKIRKMFLTCSKVSVEVDYIEQSVTTSSSKFNLIDETNLYDVPIQYNVNQVMLEKVEPLKNEITDFIESIQKGRKPLASGEDGLIALKIADAACSSNLIGREVSII